MRNHFILSLLTVLLFIGCKPRPAANVPHVSLQVFEVVDCVPGVVPKSVKGSTEKYCLAAKPVVDETDIRGAEALHNESGGARLQMFFTRKAGDRMKETTERLNVQHPRPDAPGKMAIVIDGVLIEVPNVRGVISDALVLEGDFLSWEQAVQIADSIRARG